MIKIVLKFNVKEVLVITTATKETIDKIITTMQADAVIGGDLESITSYFCNWNEEVEILFTSFDHTKMFLFLECLDNPKHFEYNIY